MKRLLFWIACCFFFSACSKEAVTKENKSGVIYLRVKQVYASGDVKYSKTVRLVRTPGN